MHRYLPLDELGFTQVEQLEEHVVSTQTGSRSTMKVE